MPLLEELMESIQNNTESLNLDDVIWISKDQSYTPPVAQEFSYLKTIEVTPLAQDNSSLDMVNEIELDIDGF